MYLKIPKEGENSFVVNIFHQNIQAKFIKARQQQGQAWVKYIDKTHLVVEMPFFQQIYFLINI